jgi:hypothetical protein
MNQVKVSAPDGSRFKAKVIADPMKLPGFLVDDRNLARASLSKGALSR